VPRLELLLAMPPLHPRQCPGRILMTIWPFTIGTVRLQCNSMQQFKASISDPPSIPLWVAIWISDRRSVPILSQYTSPLSLDMDQTGNPTSAPSSWIWGTWVQLQSICLGGWIHNNDTTIDCEKVRILNSGSTSPVQHCPEGPDAH
jgi:hypothetical protein